MSYDFQIEKPRRKPGGGMFFLIILAVGAYLIFSNLGNGAKPEGGVLDRDQDVATDRDDRRFDPDSDYQAQRDEILGEEKTAQGNKMPTTGRSGTSGDWDMKDVATQKNSDSSIKPAPSTTNNGDWAIEDVDGENKDSQFQFSNKKDSPPAKSGGDWEIEDVTKKKTEKGDWAIEETTTSKKKDK